MRLVNKTILIVLFTTIILSMLSSVLQQVCAEENNNLTDRETYLLLTRTPIKSRKVASYPSWSSLITEEQMEEMERVTVEHFKPFGPNIFPYLITRYQIDRFYGGGVEVISKFKWHETQTYGDRNAPFGNIAITSSTEEFLNCVEQGVVFDFDKALFLWWFNGEALTPVWFEERYDKWINSIIMGSVADEKVLYQKLIDIGIAAIPLWLNKLENTESNYISDKIKSALEALTNGNISPKMNKIECKHWWKNNKDKWTIHFPSSKKEYISWLANEAEDPVDLQVLRSIPITASLIQEKDSIDLIIKLIKNKDIVCRRNAVQPIIYLMGNQLPKEYALPFFEDWNTRMDLWKMDKERITERHIHKIENKVANIEYANSMSENLKMWWAKNKSLVNIHWERVW